MDPGGGSLVSCFIHSALEKTTPANHLVRDIAALIDLSCFTNDLVDVAS
jgi:hypothetical protein